MTATADVEKDVQDYILALSDQGLVDYVAAGPEAYRPEAITFAQAELNRRALTLPPEKIDSLLVSAAEKTVRDRSEADRRKLEEYGPVKIVLIFCCCCILGVIVPFLQQRLEDLGYETKAGQIRRLRRTIKLGTRAFLVAMLLLAILAGLIRYL
ncbi:MAG: hypothetical protein PHU85_10895 [Phycisphaerae bacterium]|nr:hypothetical protein [Phycisphaerae bacterium]